MSKLESSISSLHSDREEVKKLLDDAISRINGVHDAIQKEILNISRGLDNGIACIQRSLESISLYSQLSFKNACMLHVLEFIPRILNENIVDIYRRVAIDGGGRETIDLVVITDRNVYVVDVKLRPT